MRPSAQQGIAHGGDYIKKEREGGKEACEDTKAAHFRPRVVGYSSLYCCKGRIAVAVVLLQGRQDRWRQKNTHRK